MRYLFILILLISSRACCQPNDTATAFCSFIDSLKENDTLLIDHKKSGCFIHVNSRLSIYKQKGVYYAKITVNTDYVYIKDTRLTRSKKLCKQEIDSIRKFEKDLVTYRTDDSDGQLYEFYEFSLGKNKKEYFDGRQRERDWITFDRLKNILFRIKE